MRTFEEYLERQHRIAEEKHRAAHQRTIERNRTREELRRQRKIFVAAVIVWALCVVLAFCVTACTPLLASEGNSSPAERESPAGVSVAPMAAFHSVSMVDAMGRKQSVPPVPSESVPTYTVRELEILALIIYQEAGGNACSNATRQMVGEVFLNRVASPIYPDTFAEVATQYKQYGALYWTGLVWPKRAELPQEAHAVERAYDIATALLDGSVERLLPTSVIFQSENIQGTKIVAHQDGLYFCL